MDDPGPSYRPPLREDYENRNLHARHEGTVQTLTEEVLRLDPPSGCHSDGREELFPDHSSRCTACRHSTGQSRITRCCGSSRDTTAWPLDCVAVTRIPSSLRAFFTTHPSEPRVSPGFWGDPGGGHQVVSVTHQRSPNLCHGARAIHLCARPVRQPKGRSSIDRGRPGIVGVRVHAAPSHRRHGLRETRGDLGARRGRVPQRVPPHRCRTSSKVFLSSSMKRFASA